METYINGLKKILGNKFLIFLQAVLLLIIIVALAVDLSIHSDSYQQDLRAYYYAGKAYVNGLNPYDITTLSRLASEPIRHGFVYPPLTLFVFSLLCYVDFTEAYYIFLVIKIIALIMLFRLWKRMFLPEIDATFFLFSLLAFNASIYVDLRVGNVSILEQFLLWLGLYFFLMKRLRLFCILVLMAASFKLTPILFLSLLLLTDDKRKYSYLFGASVLFLVIQITPCVVNPNLFDGFLQSSVGLKEKGIYNPSTLALVRDGLDLIEQRAGFAIPNSIRLASFLAIATGVSITSCHTYKSLRRAGWKDTDRVGLFFFCMTYVLVLPRFKLYSFILLFVPSYYVIRKIVPGRLSSDLSGWLKGNASLALLTMFSSFPSISVALGLTFNPLWAYAPLIVAFYIWSRYIYELRLIVNRTSKIETKEDLVDLSQLEPFPCEISSLQRQISFTQKSTTPFTLNKGEDRETFLL